MPHLTHEELLAYIEGDKKLIDVQKASRHLDKCIHCLEKLKDIASLSLLLDFLNIQSSLKREKEILKDCVDVEAMLGFVNDKLRNKEKEKLIEHLAKCSFCREELSIIKSVQELPELEVAEKIEVSEFLPKTLRYFELLLVAYEREKVIKTKAKAFKSPLIEKIREVIFPKQPVLVPLSFSERAERDKQFYKELTDDELASFCAQSDQAAWHELVRRFTPLVFHIAIRFGLSEYRKDIWQEALSSLTIKIREYEREKGTLKAFIIGIAKNKCRKMRRWLKAAETSIEDMPAEPEGDQLDLLIEIIEKEEVEQVKEAIEYLPGEFSQILKAKIDGLQPAEIAQKFSIPINTVRSRNRRAKIRLVKTIMKENPGLLEKIKDMEWIKRNLYKIFLLQ